MIQLLLRDGILYLGYLAAVVPCILAIEAWVRGRLDRRWIAVVQRWLVSSWFLLAVGITYGMWRAYVDLGWSNQWMEDPIANGAIFPWLAEGVLLASVAIFERRGTRRDANSTHAARYGGGIAGLGAVLLVCGLVGQAFKREANVTLTAGEVYHATDPYHRTWELTSNGVSIFDAPDRHVTAVLLTASCHGHAMPFIETEQRQYVDSRGSAGPIAVAGILRRPAEDLFVVLSSAQGGSGQDDAAELHIAFNPLVQWVFPAGGIIAIGGLIGLWPRRLESRRSAHPDSALNPNVAGPSV